MTIHEYLFFKDEKLRERYKDKLGGGSKAFTPRRTYVHEKVAEDSSADSLGHPNLERSSVQAREAPNGDNHLPH